MILMLGNMHFQLRGISVSRVMSSQLLPSMVIIATFLLCSCGGERTEGVIEYIDPDGMVPLVSV
jgi:hypothetical protein